MADPLGEALPVELDHLLDFLATLHEEGRQARSFRVLVVWDGFNGVGRANRPALPHLTVFGFAYLVVESIIVY